MTQSVHDMFASIAPRYDVTNDVLSLGMHRLWRHKLVQRALLSPTAKVLDLCTGTGDLALALGEKLNPEARVVGLDFVNGMLSLAKRKETLARKRMASLPPVDFVRADAMHLPFSDASFDAATIAFGIRNVPDPVLCLREIRRVLARDGKVFVLEFGQPLAPGFKELYAAYSKHLMPLIGGFLTSNRAAYEYLPRTSRHFPAGDEFKDLLIKAGFSSASAYPLLSGLSYIYSAAVS